MYRKLGFAELAAALLGVLRRNTPYDVYDAVPEDAASPFLFAEIVGKRNASSKTTWKEVFSVNLHCIAKPSPTRTEVYQMIQAVEEAMTVQLVLPEGIQCLMQTEAGVQSMQLDDTGEWHAVLSYEIMTSNGLKIK